MSKHFWQEELGWGLALWFIGYLLGVVLFFVVPPALLGWAIMPIGIALTLWVLFKKIAPRANYLSLSLAWTTLAVLGDYIFIVKMLNPAGGYYNPDVYVYYALTFALPLLVGYLKQNKVGK